MKQEYDISESFYLQFKNTTPNRQEVDFFELGTSGSTVPLASQRANSDVPFSNLTGGTAWDYQGTLPTTSGQLDNDLLVADSGLSLGGFFLAYSDESTEDIGGAGGLISDGDSLTTILGYMNTTLLAKNSLDEGIVCEAYAYYINDGDELLITWSVYYNLPLASIPFTLKQIDLFNPSVITYAFPISPTSVLGGTWTTGLALTPNGIEISSQGDITYEELKESQVGNSYKINTINVNSQDSPQILNCLSFDYKDANGNSKTHVVCPTVDPYQYQKSIMYIDIGEVIFDGETNTQYAIEGNATVRLTFDYTKVSLSDLNEKSLGQLKQDALTDEAKQSEYDIAENYKNRYVLEKDYTLKEDYKNFDGNPLNKTKTMDYLLLGITGIGLFYLYTKT